MKRCVLTLLTCLIAATLYAQAPNWLWAKAAGGTTNFDFGHDMVTDDAGNIYLVGLFQSQTITFGSTTLTNTGSSDIFLLKSDAAGNVIWAKIFSGNGLDWAGKIALDSSGAVYIAGYYHSSTLSIGSYALSNPGSTFVAKFDSAGNALWAKTSAASGLRAYCTGIALDSGGNCYMTGYLHNTAPWGGNSISFGSIVLPGSGNHHDIFVAKYSPSGSELWAKRPSGGTDDEGRGLAVDKYGSCYVSGVFKSTSLDFGGTTLYNPTGAANIFSVKYDPAGNTIWARSSNGGGWIGGPPFGTATDSAGAFYITSDFTDANAGFGATILTNAGVRNVFVAKYDTAGTLLWATSVGGNSDVLVNDLTVAANGEMYLGGRFLDSATFGALSITGAGSTDGYILKMSSTGGVLWVKGIPGSDADNVNAVTLDEAGNGYATGGFHSTDLVLGSDTLNNGGVGRAIFIAKFAGCTAAPPQPGAVTGSAAPCASAPTTYSITPVAGATSYLWTLPNGWTGTSNTASITATPGATGGSIVVAAINVCDTSATSTFNVSSVLAAPFPVVSQSGNLLSTTASFSSYQWYRDAAPIVGATASTYNVSQTGSYHVVVTNAANCSGQSSPVNISLNVEEAVRSTVFSVFPNPVNGNIAYLRLAPDAAGILAVCDLSGKKLHTLEVPKNNGLLAINLKGLSAGLYLLRFTSAVATHTTTLLKQ